MSEHLVNSKTVIVVLSSGTSICFGDTGHLVLNVFCRDHKVLLDELA